MKNYFNTTNENGQILLDFNKKAVSQEEKIRNYFKSKSSSFKTTSSKLFQQLFKEQITITSVRRSVSNLIASHILKYTGEKTLGMYGRSENVFTLVDSSRLQDN